MNDGPGAAARGFSETGGGAGTITGTIAGTVTQKSAIAGGFAKGFGATSCATITTAVVHPYRHRRIVSAVIAAIVYKSCTDISKYATNHVERQSQEY